MIWHTIAGADELSPGQRKLCDIAGRRVALFRRRQDWIAIDNHCPHRGGPVGAGPIESRSVSEDLTCPWHGLRFDLTSGQCHESPTFCLTHLPVQVVDGEVQVRLDAPPAFDEPAIHRCLVRYGRPGHVGRFGSIDRIDCRRGDAVLVQTDRGLELGEVLVGTDEFDPRDERPPAGELLRKVDRSGSRETSEMRASEVSRLPLPMTLLDFEYTYDSQTLILYHAGEGRADLGPLAVKIAEQLGVPRVQFESLIADRSCTVAAAHPKNETPAGDETMRGPYERTKYDFRRVWECPVCHHRERTAGSVTSLFCACQAKEEKTKQLPMKLIDDGPRRVDGKTLPPRKPGLATNTHE